MPHFTINPRIPQISATSTLQTDSPKDVMSILQQQGIQEADVLRDGAYDFSVRREGGQSWLIFHRNLGPSQAAND